MMIETAGYFIVGLTKNGNKFRPSDWVERIAGSFASFDVDQRLRYNPLIMPVQRDGLSGLFVADSLASRNPAGYQFVMEFANSHQLQAKRIGQSEQQLVDITLPNVA
jgi:hypothetical protein